LNRGHKITRRVFTRKQARKRAKKRVWNRQRTSRLGCSAGATIRMQYRLLSMNPSPSVPSPRVLFSVPRLSDCFNSSGPSFRLGGPRWVPPGLAGARREAGEPSAPALFAPTPSRPCPHFLPSWLGFVSHGSIRMGENRWSAVPWAAEGPANELAHPGHRFFSSPFSLRTFCPLRTAARWVGLSEVRLVHPRGAGRLFKEPAPLFPRTFFDQAAVAAATFAPPSRPYHA